MNTPLPSPYPGLRPFEPYESSLFFGRGEHIGAMIRILRRERFLGVVGASGSGKSSLVRAGLLPAVAEGYLGGEDWRFIILRPGKEPYRNLAEAVMRATEFEPVGSNLPLPQPVGSVGLDPQRLLFRTITLSKGPNGLVDTLRDSPLPEGTGVVVLVDQFEEIFRFRPSSASEMEGDPDSLAAEARAFVEMLLETPRTAQQSGWPIYIALTMRSEYLGECSTFPELPEAINRAQFLTPRMSRDQLHDAIIRPLQQFHCDIDRQIVTQLLNDVGSRQDQLPLLQHLLLQMWRLANRESASDSLGQAHVSRRITFAEHYGPTGGLARCLDLHATKLFESLDPVQQRIAERLFRCLADRSRNGSLIRRLTSVQEVADVAGVTADEVVEVVEVFRQPGVHFLVTSPAGRLTPATSIDISHESLLRQWRRLQGWIKAEADSADELQSLVRDARGWDEGKRALLQPPGLGVLLEWRERQRPTPAWAARYVEPDDFALAVRYLEASREEEERQRKEKEEARQRELDWERQRAAEAEAASRKQRKLAFIAMAVAAVAIVSFVVAVLQSVPVRPGTNLEWKVVNVMSGAATELFDRHEFLRSYYHPIIMSVGSPLHCEQSAYVLIFSDPFVEAIGNRDIVDVFEVHISPLQPTIVEGNAIAAFLVSTEDHFRGPLPIRRDNDGSQIVHCLRADSSDRLVVLFLLCSVDHSVRLDEGVQLKKLLNISIEDHNKE